MERNDPAAPAADDGQGIPADMLADTPAEGAPNTEASPSAEVARKIGWRPLEEYRGPKDKWIDADAFLDKVQTEAPVRNERLRTLGAEAERLRRENEDLKREREQGWGEIVKRSRSAEERGFNLAISNIEEQMDAAVEQADTALYKRLKAERGNLLKMMPAPPDRRELQPNGPPQDPAVMNWVQQNPWFTTDKKLNAVAISLEAALMAEKPGLSTHERLEEVRDEVQKRFPEKFSNTARSAPPTAARPSAQAVRPAGTGKREKTFDDIPAGEREAAKAAFAQIQRRTPGYTVAAYVKNYLE